MYTIKPYIAQHTAIAGKPAPTGFRDHPRDLNRQPFSQAICITALLRFWQLIYAAQSLFPRR
jgi:hypothetical protein